MSIVVHKEGFAYATEYQLATVLRCHRRRPQSDTPALRVPLTGSYYKYREPPDRCQDSKMW